MTDTKRLNVADMDFDSIRDNLKDYLRSQDTLQDYDFEGSAISSIVDILAYATHYNAVNANIGLNETFLDTAQFRGSVVGHARMLGYTPQSSSSPIAYVDVTVNNASADERIVISRGHRFKTKIDNTTYTFVTLDEHESIGGKFENVEITQARFKTVEYIFDSFSSEKYLIPDDNVDTGTIKVEVFDSRNASTSEVYAEAKTLVGVTEESSVYFVHENPDQLFEISFGNGSVGKSPENGNVIRIEYGVTEEDSANGARIFSVVDDIDGYSEISVRTVTSARGGGPKESINSIKRNAPISFASQNRAVTARDYESVIRENFSNVLSVKAWGGEDNDPPVYGKTFVSIQPRDTDILSVNAKEEIMNDILIPKSIVTVTPEIVDPEFLYLTFDVSFRYDPTLTNRTRSQLENRIVDKISEYADENLNRFDAPFRYSNFLTAIDQSDPAILNTFADLYLQKRFVPNLLTKQTYTLDFVNNLIDPVIDRQVINETSDFSYKGFEKCFLKDVLNENNENRRRIHVYRNVGGADRVVEKDVGFIRDSRIILDNFTPNSFLGLNISVEVIPSNYNVFIEKNTILTVDCNCRRFNIRGTEGNS